ncbi:uncharacterized protein LOC131171237 [Hevea brasiliensis]|uniref:uncharacterized protein LOC131171237 n=1 Tax=Hevea brasiliensis TaxID=3981 RepID=UPI0025E407E9|nr:uncharacterized protein LOC131171237 [Hevea brasiliensis]
MCVTDMGADENNSCKAKNTGWKRRSIFWDLPYWSTNMLRHNLDVMHIEKNVFENIFNTVMNVEGKTKDNAKSREDLKEFCHRPELERDMATGKYPKASYTLDKQSKAVLCEWLKNLRFPDGYVSNMGRCIDMRKLKLFGMKSHDCHVFMQRLLPIAFRELLPKNVWQALTELSNFFRELTSTTLREEAMLQLNEEIPIILCKLERIFPPSFFDSMEHLPVHLAYEAWIAGPVQYRWMYPFERYLRKLKNNVKNKAKVEGSICNAYLVEEASSFCAHYFEPHVNTRHRKVPRNDDTVEHMDEHPGNLSIFTHSGRPLGKGKVRYLTEQEFQAAQMYILLNCIEVKPYIDIFVNELHMANPNINDKQVDEKLEREFDKWFNKYVHNPSNNISSQYEPFVLAIQAAQVNYSIYPSLKRDKDDWWAVFKIKARSVIDLPEQVNVTTPPAREEPFQEDEMEVPLIQIDDDDDQQQYLNDQNGVLVEINEEDVEDEEELELDSESDEECDDVYDSDTN